METSRAGVFISYRRVPDLPTAGRLLDSLKSLLADTCVYMDLDAIPEGRDFVAELSARISECDLFLLVVGANWVNENDVHGVRCLDRPDDFVRFEIETALRHGKKIVPVLIGDAKMPGAFALPRSIAQIANMNAFTVRHENFRRDCQLLADKIRPLLTSRNSQSASAEELKAFRSESVRAQKLVAERGPGWEYLLYYLKRPLRRFADISAGLYSLRKVTLKDDRASAAWIGEQLNSAIGMVDPLQKLMTIELPRAWGRPGLPGDPLEILHVCRLMQRTAEVIVDWEENVATHEVTENIKGAYKLLPGVAARQLDKIKGLPPALRSGVEYAIANPGQPHEVFFLADFDLPDGWAESLSREFRRAERTLRWF